jgi:hypothetical protein
MHNIDRQRQFMLIYHGSMVVANQQPVDGHDDFVWEINVSSCLCPTIILHLMRKTFTVLSMSNVDVYVIKSVNKLTRAHTLMNSHIYMYACTVYARARTCSQSVHPETYIQAHIHTNLQSAQPVNTHYGHTHWCVCADGCIHPKYHLPTPCNPH